MIDPSLPSDIANQLDGRVTLDGHGWERLDETACLGVCTACLEQITRWDAGDRLMDVPVEPQ
jgi:hypothetical protein